MDSDSVNFNVFPEQNKGQRKYLALKRKCEEVQQTNEKLVHRIYRVKKMIKRYRKERRLLQTKLDSHGDNYKEVEVPVMSEEGELYGAPAAPSSPPPQDTKLSASSIHQSAKAKSTLSSTATKPKKAKGEKKPPNAYIVFCQMQRAVIQRQYFQEHQEEVSQTELTKLLSQEWNRLGPDKKKVYYEISDQRKQEAERKQALSVQSHLRQAQASTSTSFINNFMDLLQQDRTSTTAPTATTAASN